MRTTKRVLTALAVTLLAGNAVAADDMVGYLTGSDVITYGEAHSWTGFYAGAHVGLGLLDTQDTLGFRDENLRTPLTGVHAGFNYQFGSFVFGVEADATALFLDEDHDLPRSDIKADWMGSARARIGYAFDQVMIYGTGGISLARAETISNASGRSDSNVHTGYVLGAGVEFTVSDHWVLGAEYLRHEFSEESYTLGSTFDSQGNMDIFRLRASYAF